MRIRPRNDKRCRRYQTEYAVALADALQATACEGFEVYKPLLATVLLAPEQIALKLTRSHPCKHANTQL